MNFTIDRPKSRKKQNIMILLELAGFAKKIKKRGSKFLFTLTIRRDCLLTRESDFPVQGLCIYHNNFQSKKSLIIASKCFYNTTFSRPLSHGTYPPLPIQVLAKDRVYLHIQHMEWEDI